MTDRTAHPHLTRRTLLAGAAALTAGLPGIPRAARAQTAPCSPGLAMPSAARTLGTGSAAVTVSAVGLGCMGFSFNRSTFVERKSALRTIARAVDAGVTLFDTAESYGPWTNEELVGEALRPYAGRVTIATKFGHTYRDGRMVPGVEDCAPASIRRVCEASLKRLGVETIGIFYQHRQDKNVPVEDVAGTVADLIREGKVQRFGLSMVDADTVRRAHAVCPVTAVQSRYSMFSRECETSVFPVLEELGIGFVAYAPLAIGWLAGDLNEFTRFTADNRPRISLFAPAALRANGRVIAALQDFGRERGMTPAQVALAWILAKRPWIVPIPGTTKEGHLLENQLAGDFPLTEADMAELQTLVDAVPVEGLPDFMVRHPA